MVLALAPADAGLVPTDDLPDVWGALMEIGLRAAGRAS